MSIASTARTTAVLAMLMLTGVACGSKDGSSLPDNPNVTPNSQSSQSSGTSETDTGSAGGSDCDSFTPGKDGIIQTFCDGSASAKITVDGTTTTLSGGECDQASGAFAVNIGVVAGPDFTGSKPDYLGALLPDTEGDFKAASFAGTTGGTDFLVTASGTIASGFSSVTATGTTLDGKTASIDITC